MAQRPNQNQAMTVKPADLNYPAVASDHGIDEPTWLALQNLYPGAHFASQIMAFEYCKARKLDILKKPVHIVPMYVEDKVTGQKAMRDVIMPGITETRITAARTREFAGQDEPKLGKTIAIPVTNAADAPADVKTMSVPESATVTVYRLIGGKRCGFSYTEYFLEACARTNTGLINTMWQKRPIGQLVKCATAGALRAAFPEEVGGEATAEEMMGQQTFEPVATATDHGASGIPGPEEAVTQQAAAAVEATESGDDVVDAEFDEPGATVGGVEQAVVEQAIKEVVEAKAPSPQAAARAAQQDAKIAAGKAQEADGSAFKVDLPDGASRVLKAEMGRRGVTEQQLLAKMGGDIVTANINQAISMLKSWEV